MLSKIENVEYWAEKLQENHDKMDHLTKKMGDKLNSLTIQELYELRELLRQNRSYVTLLNEDLAKTDPTPRWKKIFRK